MSTILITGATGALGSATIDHLLKLNTDHKIIGLARSEEKAASLKEKGVEVRIGNYDEPTTLEAAFSGVDTLFFISASEIGKRVEQHKNVVEAAKKAAADEKAAAGAAAGPPEPPSTDSLILFGNGFGVSKIESSGSATRK